MRDDDAESEVAQRMFRRKNLLQDTALACVERGIPVQAGTADGLPAASGWLTDVAEVRATWSVADPPNILACSSDSVAIWRLPRVAGAYGKRLYEQQRPDVWPPTMKLPDGDWITCTLPPEDDLGPLATGVKYLSPGTPVLIPPSRNAAGRRLRWDGSDFPVHPLPSAEAVLSMVLLAEHEHRELHGGI
ncbi:hypothetical protein [Kribbella deserti]|uniref:DNA primase/polymerase bifunctional N-terminal domain-containing protein n=1 Tax=Kribbella deserti TaxID=1926257 RepID=A0ABV6QDU5_9ACTN